jgi:Tfp pilus assembly protein PilX
MTRSDQPLRPTGSRRQQRGVATLFVALMILVILTIIILLSTNVGLFEQKAMINENRARLAEQAAEYTINLGGEYLKAKRNLIISNVNGSATTGGWLSADASTGRKWRRAYAPIPRAPRSR